MRGNPAPSPTSAKSISPEAALVKRSSPTARTSGSAKGSLITGWGRRLAAARAAPTMVAVAPTLLAKSHVSLSVLAMCAPWMWLLCHGRRRLRPSPLRLLYDCCGIGNNRGHRGKQNRLRYPEPAEAVERHRRVADGRHGRRHGCARHRRVPGGDSDRRRPRILRRRRPEWHRGALDKTAENRAAQSAFQDQ